MSSPIRVFVVDGCRFYKDALAALLPRQEGIELVGTAADVAEVAARLDTCAPDIVLVQASRPLCNVLVLVQAVKDLAPAARVVVAGVEENEDLIVQCVEAGASGYLPKQAGLVEFLRTLRHVHQGETLCSARVAAAVYQRVWQLAQARRLAAVDSAEELSERQFEILHMIASGLLNKEIAKRLGVTLHTVKNHVHRILEKLRVGHRRDAIRRAYERGILQWQGRGPVARGSEGPMPN